MMNPSTTPPPGSPLNVPIITVVDTSKERSGEVKPPRPPPPNTNGMPRQVKMTNSGDDGLKWCRCYLIDKAGETMTLHSFKNAIRQEEFLSRLFELFDDDEDGQIDQDVLVGRIHARLTETRQAHLAEVIVTAIYAHAFDQFIGKHTFYKILTTKELLDKVFRVIDKEGDGFVTIREVMEFLANLTNAKPRIGLTKDNLEYLEQLFRETTKGGDEIHLEDFQKIVKSKNIFFTERVFNVFDRDGSGTVSLQEFLDAINKFAGQSPDDKINFLFRIYDLDGDGLIQDNELRHVIKACMEENGMKFSEEQIEDLTMALFEDADPTGSGAITFEALKAQLAKHEGLLENLSTSIERWLVPPKPEQKTTTQKLQSFLPHQMNWRYMKNNYVFLTFLFLYLGVNAALFISRAYQYRESNEFVILARACGQCLNFTSTMILVFILRNCITWLRSHGFSSYLPLDDHIYFHKLTGALIFFYSVLHTVMHVCNVHVIVDTTPNGTLTVADFLFTTKPGVFGLVPGWAFITGDILLLILVIMVLCSMRFVRKKGNFEVFYWTHQLYVAYFVLLILHGPNFWKWFIGPGIIYVVEKIVRFIRLSTGHGKTYITEGVLLPSRVTHLVIKRPPSFDYHPGDYIFIRIPAIAGYEWHPFTISSAPEQPEFLWLHIRAVGEWTNRLYDYVEQERQRLTSMDSSSVQLSIESSKLNKSNGISIRNDIDGPKPEPRKKKSVHISPRVAILSSMGYENQSFEDDDSSSEKTAETELGPEKDPPQRTLIPPTITVPSPASTPSLPMRTKPLHKPLTTSKSMPDVEARIKHREKLLRYRENPRSASELFDQRTLQRARANAGGLGGTTYRSHRDSMAQSFKYLRTKPNVVQLSPVIDNNEEDAEAITPTPLMTGATASTPKITIDESRQDAISVSSSTIIGKPLEVYIDGPFGAPSGYIFRAQHAVLIATGIGVTPFASILQSIMRRYWKERHICPRCNYSWTGEIPQSVMNLRKVDFFWINRDQRSFEWFVNLLSQLEIEQAEQGGAMERFLDMHMYITSALQRADMKAVGLQLALDLLHEREKRDLITGLKTRTQAGRPNWNKVFKQITDQKKGKVIVFYCGPPELGRILQVKCDEFGFTFRKEVF